METPRRGRGLMWGRGIRKITAAAVAAVSTTTLVLGAPSRPAAAEPGCTSGHQLVAIRGTQEPGWLGAEIGDPLFKLMRDTMPGPLTAHRVEYPANLLDPISVASGTASLTQHLVAASARCPQLRFVVSGYSQGAAIVHAVLGDGPASAIPGIVRLPAEIRGRIDTVLLFGDPLRLIGDPGLPGPWRTGSWCTFGDPVCEPGGVQVAAHVTYGQVLNEAARFAAG